jgi:hypothetical protein
VLTYNDNGCIINQRPDPVCGLFWYVKRLNQNKDIDDDYTSTFNRVSWLGINTQYWHAAFRGVCFGYNEIIRHRCTQQNFQHPRRRIAGNLFQVFITLSNANSHIRHCTLYCSQDNGGLVTVFTDKSPQPKEPTTRGDVGGDGFW